MKNFQVTNKKLILCNCLVVPSQTSPVSRLKRKRHLNSLAMPLGDRTQMLIEILESLKGYQICLSCGFEYIRAFVSEQLGCQYKSAFCGFYRDLHDNIYIYNIYTYVPPKPFWLKVGFRVPNVEFRSLGFRVIWPDSSLVLTSLSSFNFKSSSKVFSTDSDFVCTKCQPQFFRMHFHFSF